jgi:hypothetical protein
MEKILRILLLLVEVYRWMRGQYIRHILEQKKKANGTRKPAVMQPKREQDCRFCMEEKGNQTKAKQVMPVAWSDSEKDNKRTKLTVQRGNRSDTRNRHPQHLHLHRTQ